METASQLVKNRDAATRLLRKIGIQPRDYDLFIEKTEQGFLCHTSRAQLHLAGLKGAVKEAKPLKEVEGDQDLGDQTNAVADFEPKYVALEAKGNDLVRAAKRQAKAAKKPVKDPASYEPEAVKVIEEDLKKPAPVKKVAKKKPAKPVEVKKGKGKSGPITVTRPAAKKVAKKKTGVGVGAKRCPPPSKKAVKKKYNQKKPNAPSVAGTMKEMILAGKTNAEVWKKCKEMFNLGDEKKGYPSWYRCELRRHGLLPKEL